MSAKCNKIDYPDGCTHESIRIRYARENAEACYIPKQLTVGICPGPCGYTPSPPVQPNINSENARIFQEINRCPYYEPPDNPGGLCPEEVPPSSGGYKRPPFRITGIDQIAVNVRNLASSEITSRKRYSTVRSNLLETRHAEHFRKHPPPPPCRVIQTFANPGVPVAPVTPCNLGTQRVDYSNPRR